MNYTGEEIQFIKFLESFNDYCQPAHVIAQNNNYESILPNKKGKNQFKLFNLDRICHSSLIFCEDNLEFFPKTTDAIWFKKDDDGFNIYLIEFKGEYLFKKSTKCMLFDYIKKLQQKMDSTYVGFEKSNLEKDIENLKIICSKHSDKLLNGLSLKPLETVVTALPLIYEDYYITHMNQKDVKHIDIEQFLKKSKIIYRVVALIDTDNPSKSRSMAFRLSRFMPESCNEIFLKEKEDEISKSYKQNLDSFYRRYEKAGIIDDYDFLDVSAFNNFINTTLN